MRGVACNSTANLPDRSCEEVDSASFFAQSSTTLLPGIGKEGAGARTITGACAALLRTYTAHVQGGVRGLPFPVGTARRQATWVGTRERQEGRCRCGPRLGLSGPMTFLLESARTPASGLQTPLSLGKRLAAAKTSLSPWPAGHGNPRSAAGTRITADVHAHALVRLMWHH